MTGLLVSVRSAGEARLALAGGATIVDVKEPSRGALGAADAKVWREIVSAIGGQITTSAALGELANDGVERLAAEAYGFAFAKFGLAGVDAGWRERWHKASGHLPGGVQAVPVSYADWGRARAPAPLEVLELAAQTSGFLVLDTWDKSGGTLLEYLPLSALGDFLGQAASLGVQVTLAGSLTLALVEKVMSLRPAYVGVRGAACRGGRNGPVDEERVRALANLVCGEKVTILTSGR